jgi:hypothetical protein
MNTAAPKPDVAVTPTTLSGDKSQQISDNTQKLNDITASRPAPVVQSGGFEYYGDGTPQNAPADAIMQQDENGNTWWMSGGRNYALGPDQGLSPDEKRKKDLLEQIKTQTDAAFAEQISAVQQQYNSLIQKQKDVNMRQEASVDQSLLMGGTSRYAQLNSAGINTSQISYGIQQIADLQAQENMAIAKLKVYLFKIGSKSLA